MSQDNINETVKTVSKYLIKNQKRMIREDDLKNLCPIEANFDQVINLLYNKYKELGIELIMSQFLGEKYYILTIEGKEKNITPGQYGTLALLIAYSNEIDENMSLNEIKEIFSEVWDIDIQYFLQQDYLRIVTMKDLQVIKITPLGKSLLKNVIKDLQLKTLLDVFEKSPNTEASD